MSFLEINTNLHVNVDPCGSGICSKEKDSVSKFQHFAITDSESSYSGDGSVMMRRRPDDGFLFANVSSAAAPSLIEALCMVYGFHENCDSTGTVKSVRMRR